MRAHVVAHQAGIVLAVLCLILIAAFWLVVHQSLNAQGDVFFGGLGIGAPLAVYALCRALEWISAGFSVR